MTREELLKLMEKNPDQATLLIDVMNKKESNTEARKELENVNKRNS